MARYRLTVVVERWPFAYPVQITGYTLAEAAVVLVTISDGECEGRGEASGVYYLADTPERMAAQVEAVRAQLEAGPSREALLAILPAGGARNAVDAARGTLRQSAPASRSGGSPDWRHPGRCSRLSRLVWIRRIAWPRPYVVCGMHVPSN